MLDSGQLHEHVQALTKGDDACQRQAIRCLRAIEPPEWAAAPAAPIHSLVALLQRQLRSDMKAPFIHKEVVGILGDMAPRSRSAVPQLIQLLLEGVPDPIRESAANALGKFGSEARDAVDQLIELSDGRTSLASQAIRALSDIGCADHRVRSALVTRWLSSTHSQDSRIELAIALCKLGIEAEGLLGFLTNNVITSPDESLRSSAAEALGWCDKDDLDVIPALVVASLSDKNEAVRLVAQAALKRLRLTQDKAIHACAQQLKDSAYAEAALRKSGQVAVPALIEALHVNDSVTRIKAARTLACLGELGAEAVPALSAALHDRDVNIRLAFAKALWNTSKNADVVVPVLVALLEEKSPADFEDDQARRRFLQTVIEALWRIGPAAKAALPALVTKTKDKTRLVSESARNAVKKIAPTCDIITAPTSLGPRRISG